MTTHPTSQTSPDLRAIAMHVEDDLDSDVLKTLAAGNLEASNDVVARLVAATPAKASIRLSHIFRQAISQATGTNLKLLIDTGLINFAEEDEISGRTCLHEAVLIGRIYAIQLCLTAGADLSKTDVYGRTGLHYACLRTTDMCQIAALLLENSAPVNVLDHNISSPLHYAIKQGNLETVALLLRYGADVNPRGEADYIPLSMACSLGHLEMTELLLANGAKMLYNTEGLLPLHLVARAGHLGFCQLLCSRGTDLEARDKFSGWTPIFFAASEGHEKALQELIQCGSLVDVRDEDHHTPLYYAAWEGHKAAVQVLLDAGGAFGNTESSLKYISKLEQSQALEELAVDDGIPSLTLPPP